MGQQMNGNETILPLMSGIRIRVGVHDTRSVDNVGVREKTDPADVPDEQQQQY